jgi:hypothetical protein
VKEKITTFAHGNIHYFCYMVIISSAELRNNMKKYLTLATTEAVVIQRGKTETFMLTRQNGLPEDFHRAISADEAIVRVEAGMREIIKKYEQAKTLRP